MSWYQTKTCRMVSMLSLTFSFFLCEIVFGYITNSLALIGDSYHMLSDVIALGVGLASLRVNSSSISSSSSSSSCNTRRRAYLRLLLQRVTSQGRVHLVSP